MSTALLKVESLRRTFGGLVAVHDIDLSVEQGELICIIGPNGAGKSTFFNMLCGTLQPSAGSMSFEGRNVVGMKPNRLSRIGIVRKFQVPSVFERMTVRDNLMVAAPGVDSSVAERRASEVMETLLLSAESGALGGELAHGRKQWLEIGMGLMSRPKLLLLDEPTAGMSSEETAKTANLLLGLKGRTAVIVIEHDMQFVRQLACKTLVLHQGRIIAQGPFAQLESNELVRDVYLGRQ
ncbi:branched-chain amino acid transport system ATP-binding protein [Bradyrhizobium brasilense]|uniref:Branched-chain amino acid transport system ATP-binding protein n=1 Tax=Bradyrhizobium brasilense TaxID=1419277 RepID=A0A1G7Q721_9BRAD|nr:ATP-binding cassette domain-containing protein [Bradyrhizobium brasilense]SDF94294.1 branched-chain amino acid transport system ATP-binding protein [Bradyrhizobium brasilense]